MSVLAAVMVMALGTLQSPDIEDEVPPPPDENASRVEAVPEPEPTPAPVEEGESRVLGKDREKQAVKPVPPRAPPKPAGTVRRDANGKVIMPVKPRPMNDPVRPRVSRSTGVDRAQTTSLQVLLAALPGVGLLVCGTCLACPMVPVSTVWGLGSGTLIGCLLGGACWMTLAVPHSLLATVALWIPTLNKERDVVALGAAAAAIIATNMATVLVGGLVAIAITLRWARAPSNSPVKDRLGILEALFPPASRPREFRGADVALFFNVVATMAVAAFLAPLVGVVAYTGVSYLRGIPEEEAAARRAEALRKADAEKAK